MKHLTKRSIGFFTKLLLGGLLGSAVLFGSCKATKMSPETKLAKEQEKKERKGYRAYKKAYKRHLKKQSKDTRKRIKKHLREQKAAYREKGFPRRYKKTCV